MTPYKSYIIVHSIDASTREMQFRESIHDARALAAHIAAQELNVNLDTLYETLQQDGQYSIARCEVIVGNDQSLFHITHPTGRRVHVDIIGRRQGCEAYAHD